MRNFSTRRTVLLAFILTLTALAFFLLPLDAPAADPLGCATAPVTADPTPTVCLSNMVVVFNGVSPDNQFVVSWRTVKSEKGQVRLSAGATFDDIRGSEYQATTHYVVVSNLDAKTNYTFDIISGGKTYTNNNAHWSIRTGPPLQPETPYTIIGRVSNADGSEADGALVYAQVRDGDKKDTSGRSTWLSTIVVVPDGGNFFNINLGMARIPNNTQKYVFDVNNDRVLIIASSAQGKASKGFKINELHPPAAPPSLILAENGVGSAATATATPPPPTFTPTLSPTATATATPLTPTPTQTPTAVPPSATPEAVTETAQAEATQAQAEATQTAAATETAATSAAIAMPADKVETSRTRVYGGVPTVIPPRETNNINWTLLLLAAVLIVGAGLLGLAAFFVTRKS